MNIAFYLSLFLWFHYPKNFAQINAKLIAGA